MAESWALHPLSAWHIVTPESFLIAGEPHTKQGAVGGMVDPKTYVHVPEPVNVASLGKGVLADVIKDLEMTTSRITWEGSESNDNCPCKRQRSDSQKGGSREGGGRDWIFAAQGQGSPGAT